MAGRLQTNWPLVLPPRTRVPHLDRSRSSRRYDKDDSVHSPVYDSRARFGRRISGVLPCKSHPRASACIVDPLLHPLDSHPHVEIHLALHLRPPSDRFSARTRSTRVQTTKQATSIGRIAQSRELRRARARMSRPRGLITDSPIGIHFFHGRAFVFCRAFVLSLSLSLYLSLSLSLSLFLVAERFRQMARLFR